MFALSEAFWTLQTCLDSDFPFSMGPGYPHAMSQFHPVLLVFHTINLLKFGHKPLSSLRSDNGGIFELYTPVMIAFVNFIFIEYFGSNATTFFTGAQCEYTVQLHALMCALMCILICFPFS